MKILPIGQQDFEPLQQDNCIYVDKTVYIHRLISNRRVFFLSRPRRFGKSPLLSTIKAAFEGKKDLFKGLYIEDKIDRQPYRVLTLDMIKGTGSVKALKIALASSLRSFAEDFKLGNNDTWCT